MCLNDPISKLGDVNARKMCLRPAQGVTVGSFLEIKTALMGNVDSYCPHVRACNQNLHEFNQKGIRELRWAQPPQHSPPSKQALLALNGIILVSRSWRVTPVYLEMRNTISGVMANWHQEPSSRVKRGRDCSSYLTFGCHSLHPNDGIRETLNFQNITSRGRILDKISLTEIKILIHSIQIPLKERKKSSQHKQIYSDKADSAENFKCIKNLFKK